MYCGCQSGGARGVYSVAVSPGDVQWVSLGRRVQYGCRSGGGKGDVQCGCLSCPGDKEDVQCMCTKTIIFHQFRTSAFLGW